MKKGMKIALLSLGALALGGGVTLAFVSASKQAQEQETVNVVDESDEEQDALAKMEEWAQEKWDTFLSPVIGSVSVTALLSFSASIILAVAKDKKLNEKIKVIQELFVQMSGFASLVEKISKDANESKEASGEMMEAVSEFRDAMQKLLVSSKGQAKELGKIKPILKLLVQIEAKLAECDQSVISSGALKDVKEVKALIENF